MSSLFPAHCRYGAQLIVSGHQLAQTKMHPAELFRLRAMDLAHAMTRKILEMQVKREPGPFGGDVALVLDCYVFSPQELQELLMQARREGAEDSLRWSTSTPSSEN